MSRSGLMTRSASSALHRVVVAGTSVRLLAQSARAAGYLPIAIDAFGDVDTRAAATDWFPLSRPGTWVPDHACLLSALEHAQHDPCVVGWIAGSGLEGHADLLAEGAQRLRLLGNSPLTIRRIRTPGDFFPTLEGLGIATPETRVQAPTEPTGWLFKDAHACGGWHIRPAARAPRQPGPGAYYQREAQGVPLSALFVANGSGATVIGLARQIVAPLARRPHVYRGCVGPVDLGAHLTARIAHIIEQLTRHYALRGLNGIDFMLGADGIRVLELNPRPTASLALFDDHVAGGLVAAHVRACTTGELPTVCPDAAAPPVRGSEVTFAPRAGTITPHFADWLAEQPECHDLPAAGTRYDRHDPLCSVSAHGSSIEEVLCKLARRRDAVLMNRDSGVASQPPVAAQRAFRWACFMDVASFKPGNVSMAEPGHDMQAQQFLDSATASVTAMFDSSKPVGARVHAAVRATRAAVGCNTNLGILLLSAPIALAVERAAAKSSRALRTALDDVLAALDLDDAREAFAAITHANPGGLGQAAAQDVHAAPSVGLRQAMTLAADKDTIATQYANGYADVFRALDGFLADASALPRRVQRLYLTLLAQHPDSHIARKYGVETALAVSGEAVAHLAHFDLDPPATLDKRLHDWDISLKQRRLNPGTSADLTVCVLFVAALLNPALMHLESWAMPQFWAWNGDC